MIHRNRFSGPDRPELSKLKLLQLLALNDNELEGLIPENLSELKQITDPQLQNNKFVGPIARAISKLESLSYLDLSGNKLNGTMPNSLARLNNIDGSFPGSLIANAKNLQISLNLSYNFMDKTIPDEIIMLKMVKVTGLSNNNLSGSIPRALKGCRNLISLDLSGNNLSSQVPHEIFPLLSELVNLNLSRNQLNGALPENLASPRHLSSLDLSQSKFEGIIPKSLANIFSLKFLNTLSICLKDMFMKLVYLVKYFQLVYEEIQLFVEQKFSSRVAPGII